MGRRMGRREATRTPAPATGTELLAGRAPASAVPALSIASLRVMSPSKMRQSMPQGSAGFSRARKTLPAALLSTALLVTLAATAGSPAAAQNIPGISVWVPPASEKQPPPPAAPQAKQPAKQAPKKAARPPSKPAKSAALKTPNLKPGEARALSASAQSIAVLVNDEPITGYEIQQRQRMIGLSTDIQGQAAANFKRLLQNPSTTERLKAILDETIKANRNKTKEQIIAIFEERKKQYALSLQKQAVESARASMLPSLRKAALDELIDEKLKLQEAKRLNLLAGDDEANMMVKNIAERNKMTEAQFAQHLKSMGADISAMRERFRANISWHQVIRRRFGHQITVTERDIDRIVASAQSDDDALVELELQRITLAVPGKLDQKVVAQRIQEAEALRRKANGCKGGQALAASIKDARFEALGRRKASAIAEPTRSLLLSAKDGEMLPPSVGQGGVELWAVCSRTTMTADLEKRTAAQEELRQKEFEVLAQRHLKDLRQDAHIEYR